LFSIFIAESIFLLPNLVIANLSIFIAHFSIFIAHLNISHKQKHVEHRFIPKKKYVVLLLFSPSGEVTIAVTGRNSSIPEFELPLLDKVNQNWTVGPFLVAYNQTSLIPIES